MFLFLIFCQLLSEVMPQSFQQIKDSKQLPRITLKWIIIVCGVTTLVLNIVLLKFGLDSLSKHYIFDQNLDNMKNYRLAKVLFVVILMSINSMIAVGMVGARNKHLLMSTISSIFLSLLLLIHVFGFLLKVKIPITEPLVWDLFHFQHYNHGLLGFHLFFTLATILHNYVLWKETKKIKLKLILTQQTSAV